MAVQIVPSPTTVDHIALDRIVTHLERAHGFEPRIERGLRLFLAGNVSLFDEEPTSAQVLGDRGQTYTATATGYCSCVDASQNHMICKHQFSVKIACQMRAVARAKAAQQNAGTDLREHFARLTREHQRHGAALIASGQRPIDCPIYTQRDLSIQRLKAQLPVATLVR